MLPVDDKVYLREKEVARLYNLSVNFFTKARHEENPVPHYKKGTQIFYLKHEVDEWFKNILIKNN